MTVVFLDVVHVFLDRDGFPEGIRQILPQVLADSIAACWRRFNSVEVDKPVHHWENLELLDFNFVEVGVFIDFNISIFKGVFTFKPGLQADYLIIIEDYEGQILILKSKHLA